MFDIGATELLVVAVVAIVVVGPKDLPRMLRTVGQMVGKAKAMAREFQVHFNEAADEAGLDEVRKGIDSVKQSTSISDFSDTFKPLSDTGDEIKREIEKAGSGSTTSNPDTSIEVDAETAEIPDTKNADSAVGGSVKQEKQEMSGEAVSDEPPSETKKPKSTSS